MSGVEERRVDGFLKVGGLMRQPQQEDELPLILLIAAGRAESDLAAIRVSRH